VRLYLNDREIDELDHDDDVYNNYSYINHRLTVATDRARQVRGHRVMILVRHIKNKSVKKKERVKMLFYFFFTLSHTVGIYLILARKI